jgi:hypothetical protein
MQTTTKMILAICCIGAVAVETLTPVYAQHRHRTSNGCPRGWTAQGGRCAPYQWGGSGVRLGWRLEQQLGWWLEQQLGWWLEHLEWMPTRSDDTGWKMRALPMGKVGQAAKYLLKHEARQIAANIAKLPELLRRR